MTISFEPPPTYAEPVVVDEKTKKALFNPIWLKWFVDIAAFISANGGGSTTIQHNSLAGLQGGSLNEYYHLTAAQVALVGGGVTQLIAGTNVSLSPLGGTGNVTVNVAVSQVGTGHTVAGLPAGTTGLREWVTDASAPTWGSAVVGGGAVTVPVFYNGSTWIVG